MRRSLLRITLAGLLCASACRSVSYDADAAQKLQRVAIVVRVLGNASGELPEAARGAETPEQVGKKVERAMSAFEVAERIRSGLIEHLPDAPPWNAVVPGVQAESVLGDMLTVDRPVKSPEFDELQRLGVDGVLYVQVERWGVAGDETQAGYLLQGSASFFTIPGHDTLWKSPLDAQGGGPLGKGWSDLGEVRTKLGEVCARAGEQLALQLGGTTQSVTKTPSLDSPEIEDKGHPPEKRKTVIPFVIPETTDGGAARDGGAGIDLSSFPDGGELPTPGK